MPQASGARIWFGDEGQSKLAYIIGINDVMANRNEINGFKACVPPRVTIGRLADVVTQFLASRASTSDQSQATGFAASRSPERPRTKRLFKGQLSDYAAV
jgi:hypothetical protein